MKQGTRLIRERAARPSAHNEHSEALHLTSSFCFASAADMADAFANQGSAHPYSRPSNPSTDTLARRVAALEGAEFALCTASGMGAILSLCMGLLDGRSRVVASGQMFGATLRLLCGFLRKFGVRVDFVPGADLDDWRRALAQPADLVLAETPSNPMLEILDLAAVADMARGTGAHFAVDNCFCPSAQRPLEHGAHLVVHSGTKYLDGQGRVLCGAIAGGRELLMERVQPFLRNGGPTPSPFNAWVVARGMETLALRYAEHCRRAAVLAQFLRGQPGVARVLYTGLAEHPRHELAMRQQGGMGGGVLSFELAGGAAAAWRFADALRLFSRTPNFGDTRSTVVHPASTTHSQMPDDIPGVADGLLRLSAGLEDLDDLQEDLERGLAALPG